jgi:hypothetical protein
MGVHGSIANNLYLNVFQPHHQAVWGSTVLLYTPGKKPGVECLEVRAYVGACVGGLGVELQGNGSVGQYGAAVHTRQEARG